MKTVFEFVLWLAYLHTKTRWDLEVREGRRKESVDHISWKEWLELNRFMAELGQRNRTKHTQKV